MKFATEMILGNPLGALDTPPPMDQAGVTVEFERFFLDTFEDEPRLSQPVEPDDADGEQVTENSLHELEVTSDEPKKKTVRSDINNSEVLISENLPSEKIATAQSASTLLGAVAEHAQMSMQPNDEGSATTWGPWTSAELAAPQIPVAEPRIRRTIQLEPGGLSLQANPVVPSRKRKFVQDTRSILTPAEPPPAFRISNSSEGLEPSATVSPDRGVGGGVPAFDTGVTLIGPSRTDVNASHASPPASLNGTPNGLAGQIREVSHQLIEAVRGASAGSFEVQLNPRELGSVNIRIVPSESSVFVTLSAERPETSDLLRRHVDLLVQEFKAAGYGNETSLAFSGKGAGNSGAWDGKTAFGVETEEQSEVHVTPPSTASGESLNIVL